MQDTNHIVLAAAIARFRELRSVYGHLPHRGKTDEVRRLHRVAHTEMFYLAQLITSLVAPVLQAELDATRREIMEQIRLAIKVPVGARMIARQYSPSAIIWSEFQITPEVSFDPGVNNSAVLRPLVRRLMKLLRTQVATVNGRLYR